MADKIIENNQVSMMGKIAAGFTFSHQVFGEGFYMTELLVKRLSDSEDRIPVLFRRLGMLGLEPAAILLTHGHYDHIAGVEQVREKYDIPVYVHTLDAHMLTDGHANLGDWISTQPFQPVQAWETVEDGDTLQFGDSTFTVLHTPGHTSGSVSETESTGRGVSGTAGAQ